MIFGPFDGLLLSLSPELTRFRLRLNHGQKLGKYTFYTVGYGPDFGYAYSTKSANWNPTKCEILTRWHDTPEHITKFWLYKSVNFEAGNADKLHISIPCCTMFPVRSIALSTHKSVQTKSKAPFPQIWHAKITASLNSDWVKKQDGPKKSNSNYASKFRNLNERWDMTMLGIYLDLPKVLF